MEYVTDSIVDAFRLFETQVDLLTRPLEKTIHSGLLAAFPHLMRSSTRFLAQIRSPYTNELPLMNPYHVAAIVVAYLAVIGVGRVLMSRVGKFQISSYALAHNVLMTTLSAFMCVEILRQAWIGGYSFFGNDYVNAANGGRPMAKIVAVFYLSKILEFNDTLIMVLKKNFHQITFLHVYHHASVFVIWWFVTMWSPNGESYFSAALNSFIHVIMYGYYFLSAMGFKQVSFVKKYITAAQMTQFVLMMVQATYNIVTGYSRRHIMRTEKGKPYPLGLAMLLWVYMVTMLALFGNFYMQDRKKRFCSPRPTW